MLLVPEVVAEETVDASSAIDAEMTIAAILGAVQKTGVMALVALDAFIQVAGSLAPQAVAEVLVVAGDLAAVIQIFSPICFVTVIGVFRFAGIGAVFAVLALFVR